jgi:hypothetical protein
MYLAESCDRSFVLEGKHLPGCVVWLFFGGIFAATLLAPLRAGEPEQLLVTFLCGGPLLIGIPFVAFATSSYARLEVESGNAIRKYAVYRLTGRRLLHDIAWDRLYQLIAEREFKLVEDGLPHYALKLTAVTSDGTTLLGRFDAAAAPNSLDEPIELLRRHFGDKLALEETKGVGSRFEDN